MKAQRATVELGMLGGWYLVAGLAALLSATERGVPELSPVAMLAIVGSLLVIGIAVHRLREIQGLPETAQRVGPGWAAARASLPAVVPVATCTSVGQTLGLTYAVLGGAICVAAVMATHVEYLCGARVWRCHSRFYFAR